ncbi:hypothetical protein CYLTODRAFT_261096 [Cylindrobasidium torrendii FP15055 ss-10]|uniref:Zn(2)-C6 fungal-type domain-containing protein n=1 Tax=Cylindrobasidium torrendii FP15055 ss-10 TaxID=1314674 RepID=A0A0D7AUF9_9AGAR|nr:hypothetical protein CYLTODRAFT_261096 [Cylindrobasidium torrendii FP15055 ss-10]
MALGSLKLFPLFSHQLLHMSASESDTPPPSATASTSGSQKPKKRRLAGSCDHCRKRKIRCDSAKQPDNICTNCRANHGQCTHEMTKKRSAAEYLQQISQLEGRVRSLENELRTQHDETSPAGPSTLSNSSGIREDPVEARDGTPQELNGLLEDFLRLSTKDKGMYFGPSSYMHYVTVLLHATPQAGTTNPFEMLQSFDWNGSVYPWNVDTVTTQTALQFPDTDLLEVLVDLYFRHQNLPILHEPTFRAELRANLHFTSRPFGYVLLAVCAIAALHNEDMRTSASSERPTGFQYIVQAAAFPRPLIQPVTAYDIQFSALYGVYMVGATPCQSVWSVIGQGVRYALDFGYHRLPQGRATVEDEINKRLFWSLMILDQYSALYYGRPYTVCIDSIEVDLPIDIDELNISSIQTGAQPSYTPRTSTHIAATIHHIRLIRVFAYVSKTIYGRQLQRPPPFKSEHTLGSIDAALQTWFHEIPDHLQWSPNHNGEFFLASARLYMAYYDCQIYVHRPFVHSDTPQALRSMKICLNAARSIVHVAGYIRSHTLSHQPFVDDLCSLLNVANSSKARMRRTVQTSRATTSISISRSSCYTIGQIINLIVLALVDKSFRY